MYSFLAKALAALTFSFFILFLLGLRKNNQPTYRMGNSDSEPNISPLASALSGLSGLDLSYSVVLEDDRRMPRYEWREYNSWGDNAPGWYRGVGHDEWDEDLYGPFEDTYPPGGPSQKTTKEAQPFTRTGFINTSLLTPEEREDLQRQTDQATAALKETMVGEYREKENRAYVLRKATNVWVERSYIAADPRGKAIIQQVEKKWLASEKGRNSVPGRSEADKAGANTQKMPDLNKVSKTPSDTGINASGTQKKNTEKSDKSKTNENTSHMNFKN